MEGVTQQSLALQKQGKTSKEAAQEGRAVAKFPHPKNGFLKSNLTQHSSGKMRSVQHRCHVL